MLNILKLRNQLLEKYKSYTGSFLNIRDRRLKEFAEQKLKEDYLWAEHLLQCNPGYEKGESVKQLVAGKTLHPDMEDIFKGFELYKHQAEAIKAGSKGKGFIVTSGTGSGKSLTYIGSIFNRILHLPESERKGVKAIIVYPMNALINSQELEIEKYQKEYEQERGEGSFPITYQKYTGQESEADKKRAIENPPNIILTNYMMLELLLTRTKEADLRDSIFKELEFLVFDELHFYKGRQGADVAFLIRRIKARAEKQLICMGTSATLSSGTLTQQKKDVAYLGKQLFGEDFEYQQIIGENLKCQIEKEPEQIGLKEALQQSVTVGDKSWENIFNHPLSFWMERNVALKKQEGEWIRGIPRTIADIVKALAKDTELPSELIEERLGEFLEVLQKFNQHSKEEFLPFRVHQFITQTIPIKVSLETPEKRLIKCQDEHYTLKDDRQIPIFPVYFNHQSGFPYLRVSLNGSEIIPQNEVSEEEQAQKKGYILMDDEEGKSIWNPEEQFSILPDSWITIKKNGTDLKSDKRDAVPKLIYFNVDGHYSFKPKDNYSQGWFVPQPLKFDPISSIFYPSNTREGNKFYQVGESGRSMSTTILSYSVLQQLKENKTSPELQKIMSFTDSRQDAALQAGHFNDFMRKAFIRSSIYHALKKYKSLECADIGLRVFEEMNLQEEEYAQFPGHSHTQTNSNQKAFKEWLYHHIFKDLERGWKQQYPNLEQTACIEIQYSSLKQECADDEAWIGSPFLTTLNAKKRYEFITQFLNYFRSSYALDHPKLERDDLEINKNRMQERLKPNWLYRKNEVLMEPFWMRTEKLNSKKVFTQSIGPLSAVGKYFKFFVKQNDLSLKDANWKKELAPLLACLVKAGYLKENRQFPGSPLYRLNLNTVRWVLGNEKDIVEDEVRNRSFKDHKTKPNVYFQNLYQVSPSELKKMVAQEHTGQVPAEERKEIEQDFRKARTQALYCSPTMELGIDIDELSVVHMRNVPPNPSNYAQRSGRAGRKGQGALILTFCSKRSAHDQHFFRNKMDMISGKVTPQKLDLIHPDLLKTHLQAIYLSECRLNNLNQSIFEILDIDKEGLPLKPSIQEQLELPAQKKEELELHFQKVVKDFEMELQSTFWFSPSWIMESIKKTPHNFNEACNRWREMYYDADQAKKLATSMLEMAHLTKNSPEWQEADNQVHQTQRKLDLLRNKTIGRDFSEFYPYRYLASEAFLPGYNFTRLPVRVYLPSGENGVYLSRPRLLGLTEFGPGNIIYQRGRKWKVVKMQLPTSKKQLLLETASVDKKTGFISFGVDAVRDINPFTGKANRLGGNSKSIPNLCKLQDMVALDEESISCYEDERVKKGYNKETFFSYPGDLARCEKLDVSLKDEHLLNLHFLPGAQLVEISNQWQQSTNKEGFLIGQNGAWKTEKNYESLKDEEKVNVKRIKLFTTLTTDCLYLEPLKNLRLKREGVITLMYALKKALESIYHIETQEISCELMGDSKQPNILFYESTEGSLNVLSRLSDEQEFNKWIKEAYAICRFEIKGVEEGQPIKASYEDLLSYYNQAYHSYIDRFAIKETLENLKKARFNSEGNEVKDVSDNFKRLCTQLSGEAERKKEFLSYLEKHRYPLPDRIDYKPAMMPKAFHFYYEESRTGIMIRSKNDSENTEKSLDKKGIEILKLKMLDCPADISISDFILKNQSFFSPTKD